MKSWVFATLVLFLFAFAYVEAAAPDATCKEFVSTLTKKQLGGIATCSKTLKFKSPKEKSSKMNCILKCVMIKEGMLDENGQFVSDEQLMKFADEMVPANLLDKVLSKFKECREKTGQMDNEDEFCKSYDPMIKCMLDMIGTLCK